MITYYGAGNKGNFTLLSNSKLVRKVMVVIRVLHKSPYLAVTGRMVVQLDIFNYSTRYVVEWSIPWLGYITFRDSVPSTLKIGGRVGVKTEKR
jgi:hypothetical protein